MERIIIRIWITLLGKPNHVVTDLLLKAFGTLESAWKCAENGQIPEILQEKPRLIRKLADSSLRKKAAEIYQLCMRRAIRIALLEDEIYPSYLREIINKPSILYYKGKLPAEASVDDSYLLSVVGSRRCTAYGRGTAFLLSKQLAEYGIGIVSGMARGIDSEAHRGALSVSGYTMAVLGGGADVIYPPENQTLYERICQTGCVLSEYPPGIPPFRNHFPARNRIISGLTAGTLVVEATKSSGAMITVDRAIEQSRTVYAVPGNITSDASAGCNELLKSQVKCVTSCMDILEDYGMQVPRSMQDTCGWLHGLTGAEAAAASAIAKGNYDIDTIIRAADLSAGSISSALTMLEIKGIVTKASDGTYKLMK